MAGTHGYGTVMLQTTDEPDITIANITSITLGAITVDSLDVGAMDSTAQYRGAVAGMIDPGEISISAIYDESEYDYLKGELDGVTTAWAVAVAWKITFPDSSYYTFNGIITSLTIDDPFDDKMTMDFTIKVSGKPAFTVV